MSAKHDKFERAPCLFPWYGGPDVPRLTRDGDQLAWNYVEKIGDQYVGLITLNQGDELLGIVKIYTCVLASRDSESFLVWARDSSRWDMPPLTLSLYSAADLVPMTLDDQAMRNIAADDTKRFVFEVNPQSQIVIPVEGAKHEFEVDFPKEFLAFDDFIAVDSVHGLYPGEDVACDTALIEIRPSEGRVTVFPQDWFNRSETMDFGYQWITRAVRDVKGGPIVVDGIRLGSFELDETGRQLA